MIQSASQKYPATPVGARLYMALYPFSVIAVASSASGLWLYGVVIALGLLWIGTVAVFFATTFRREGYQAAIDDLAGDAKP